MKNISHLLKLAVLIFLIISLSASRAEAQDPPPPPPAHGTGGNVPGGGAPVGSGLLFLTVLGAAYGLKKIRSTAKNVKIN